MILGIIEPAAGIDDGCFNASEQMNRSRLRVIVLAFLLVAFVTAIAVLPTAMSTGKAIGFLIALWSVDVWLALGLGLPIYAPYIGKIERSEQTRAVRIVELVGSILFFFVGSFFIYSF